MTNVTRIKSIAVLSANELILLRLDLMLLILSRAFYFLRKR